MNPLCVLAVDDDRIALRIVEAALRPNGCELVTACDLATAKARLAGPESERFACVLIDQQLPDGHGTELLRWLRERDSPIAGVMVTASEQHSLVKETMVEGACNFLHKPIVQEELREAVKIAALRTQRRRELRETWHQVETAGQIQERLLQAMLRTDACVEYKFCPMHDCGGDFLAHHRLSNGDELFVVSDVSGHDVGATVQSSFFHGWMSGYFSDHGDVDTALDLYNARLVGMNGTAGSVAVTAVRVNRDSACLTAWNCGGSPPVFVDWRGRVQRMTTSTSSPLGWFDPIHPPRVTMGIPPGPVWLWTDGLDSLADQLGASPLALAYPMLNLPNGYSPAWLKKAADDILVARIWPGRAPGSEPEPYFHPLIAEEYDIPSAEKIDAVQHFWKISLELALPQLPAATVHDILLASRESLLNALKHGCCGCETAVLQILYHPRDRLIRLRVEDPGAGHAFDWRTLAATGREPPGAHCGLWFIHSLASQVCVERGGADLTIDFRLSPNFDIVREDQHI